MGLDTTHNCWHGAYSAFMRWRCMIAKAAGLPPLPLMEGFYMWTDISADDVVSATRELGYQPEHEWAHDMIFALIHGGNFPIKWECLKPSPLHALLSHSDCDGIIPATLCAGIANELQKILPMLPDGGGGGHVGDWRAKTQAFIDGLLLAADRGEDVEFG